jgi:hypothetical protein
VTTTFAPAAAAVIASAPAASSAAFSIATVYERKNMIGSSTKEINVRCKKDSSKKECS